MLKKQDINTKFGIMKTILIKLPFSVIILLFPVFVLSQSYILPNEAVVHSFQTESGKIMELARDTANKYLVYRFGTKNKVELAFPKKYLESWKQFSYSYYLRDGGAENEGLDLNYLYFTIDNIQYVIYDTYVSSEGKNKIGIKVIDLKTKKTVDIKGKVETQKGLLMEFRNNNLVVVGDKMFD